MSIDDHTGVDVSPEPRASPARTALHVANRALQIGVPAYGLATVGTWFENRNAPVKTRFNGSGFLGGLAGIALSGVLTLGVDSVAYPIVAQAHSPHAHYIQQVTPQERGATKTIVLGFVSPLAYAVDAATEGREVSTKLTVTFEDGADRGSRAQCTYAADAVVPVVELDALGRPARLEYRNRQVSHDSLVGSTIEEQCDAILASERDDLVDSFRYLGE